MRSESRLQVVLLVTVLGALALSAISPADRTTWFMEVAPVMIVVPLLIATRTTFALTPLVYILIAAHALVLILGGAYTYAHIPAGFWLQDMFGFERNPYDRVGHFFQGFVPALVAREILLRKQVLSRGGWLFFLVCCVCLAISAVYELIEWGAAVAMGQGAVEFLGTQGDPWDTQSDMAMALIGAITALLALTRLHDRQLEALRVR